MKLIWWQVRAGLSEARDYALVYQGGKRRGILDRRLSQKVLDVDLTPAQAADILLEDMGRFDLESVGDTFFDIRRWGKGCVWIHGAHLSRYWRIGPPRSLFVPSGWLKRGRNEIIVLDLEEEGHRSVQGLKKPVYETPKTGPRGQTTGRSKPFGASAIQGSRLRGARSFIMRRATQ